MTEAPTFVEPTSELVWDVPDVPDVPESPLDVEPEAVSTPVAATPVLPDAPIDLTALTAKQRAELIKMLATANKVEREAKRVERTTRTAAALGGVDTSELDLHMFGDVAPKLLATPLQTTAKNDVGFHRHSGSYTHNGVAYHVTVTAKRAQRRGRKPSGE